jgi:alkyl hydroperoxide reductase subunit AhpC
VVRIVKLDTQILGVTADSFWSNQVFARVLGGLSFKILSDWFGYVGRLYGVWDKDKQREKRHIFIIDSTGIVRWQQSYRDDELPDLSPILHVLEEIATAQQRRIA